MENMASSSIDDLDLIGQDVMERLAWCAIDKADLERVRELAPFAEDIADTVIERFYEHILSFDKAADMFADEATIDRVKAGQKTLLPGVDRRALR